METLTENRAYSSSGRAEWAWLVGLAAGAALLHAALNGQYGFHRDELDILMNARQLAWGYVAYPPFTPFVARIALELFGPSLVGMRLFSALAQGVVVLLAGLMARDLGGGRRGQAAAAVAVFSAPIALTCGTLIQYMAFDYLWWVVVAFCFVRRLRSEDRRWWLGVGAGIGLGAMTKYTIAFWVLGLAVAVLLTETRRDLRSPWLWAGAGLALLICLPNLIWQVQHDFISLDFLSAIHARDVEWGRTDDFLVDQLYATTLPLTLPLWLLGLYFCLLRPEGRRFRGLGWWYLATLGLLWASQARGYYVAPAYVMLLAAGCAWGETWLLQRPPRVQRAVTYGAGTLLVLGAALGVALVKPVAPINSGLWKLANETSDVQAEMIGWPELVEQVAQIYSGISESERPRTAILAGNYGEAGALELYGPAYGLPQPISGANSLWERGYGNPPPETVILVGFTRDYAYSFFRTCDPVGRVSNRYQVKNEESTHHTTLFVCREARRPWEEMWKDMRWFQ